MAHSYSSISTHSKCARKYQYAYILRVPVKSIPSPQMERGTAVGESIENFMLRRSEQLHPDIHKSHGQMMLSIRESTKCTPERKWAVTSDWKKTKFDSKDAWLRGVFDLDTPTEVYEWKTGKVYDDHIDQRYLYGLIKLILEPKLDHTIVREVYFDQKGKDANQHFLRDHLEFMKQDWVGRVARVEGEKIFSPNPTYLCGYCSFSKQNGGPCEF